jgi:YfaZ precursor
VTTTTPTTVTSNVPGTPVVSGVPTVGTARTGACLKSNVGDTLFVGGTFSGKIGTIGLDGGIVYGQRQLPGALNATCSAGVGKCTFQESGWGFDVAATIPINPVTVTVQGWYTSGDKDRAPGDTSFANGAGNAVITRNGKQSCAPGTLPAGYTGCYTGDGAGANGQNNSGLVRSSDRLPSPDDQGTWYTRPLIAEIFFGEQTIGGPPEGTSSNYAEKGGTWGIGGAAMLAITPSLSVGAGVAYVGASDAKGVFGNGLFEADGGVFYTLNANLSIQGIAGYIVPDQGDNAWGAAVRTVFNF